MHLGSSLVHTTFVGIFIIYFLTACHMTDSTGALVIALKLKAVYRFCVVLMLYIIPESYINETCLFFRHLLHTFLGPILTHITLCSTHKFSQLPS
jgi:hypothetical protein